MLNTSALDKPINTPRAKTDDHGNSTLD